MLCQQLVCWCNQEGIVSAGPNPIKTHLLGAFKQSQECCFCFAGTCVVRVDNNRLFRIVSPPLVIERVMSLLWGECGGGGILLRPHVFILSLEVDRKHHQPSFLRFYARASTPYRIPAGIKMLFPSVAVP